VALLRERKRAPGALSQPPKAPPVGQGREYPGHGRHTASRRGSTACVRARTARSGSGPWADARPPGGSRRLGSPSRQRRVGAALPSSGLASAPLCRKIEIRHPLAPPQGPSPAQPAVHPSLQHPRSPCVKAPRNQAPAVARARQSMEGTSGCKTSRLRATVRIIRLRGTPSVSSRSDRPAGEASPALPDPQRLMSGM
jgi:hypothetical protein